MRVGFAEWPEALEPLGTDWAELAERVGSVHIDLLVTNELPFGRWIAADSTFDRQIAQASVDVHSAGLSSLSKLDVSSGDRPDRDSPRGWSLDRQLARGRQDGRHRFR
jgi:N-carbamoylputrescine amidase